MQLKSPEDLSRLESKGKDSSLCGCQPFKKANSGSENRHLRSFREVKSQNCRGSSIKRLSIFFSLLSSVALLVFVCVYSTLYFDVCSIDQMCDYLCVLSSFRSAPHLRPTRSCGSWPSPHGTMYAHEIVDTLFFICMRVCICVYMYSYTVSCIHAFSYRWLYVYIYNYVLKQYTDNTK